MISTRLYLLLGVPNKHVTSKVVLERVTCRRPTQGDGNTSFFVCFISKREAPSVNKNRPYSGNGTPWHRVCSSSPNLRVIRTTTTINSSKLPTVLVVLGFKSNSFSTTNFIFTSILILVLLVTKNKRQ